MRDRLSLIALALLFCALHLIYANTPLINYEYTMLEAGRYFFDPSHQAGLEIYLMTQGNPFGYPWIVSALLKLGLPASYLVTRLPALIGYLLILLSVSVWLEFFKKEQRPSDRPGLASHWLYCFLSLSPMIWIYSGRATADILPAGLGLLSISLLMRSFTVISVATSALLFSLAFIVKYNVAFLGLGILLPLLVWPKATMKERLLKTALWGSIAASCAILYGLYTFKSHGFFYLNPRYNNGFFSGYLTSAPQIAFLYLSFLGLMTFPLPLLMGSPGKKSWLVPGIVSAGVTALMIAFPYAKEGELSYGFMSRIPFHFLIEPALLFVGLMSCLLLIQRAALDVLRRDRFSIFIAAALLPYLFVLFMMRPAQRYIILILPVLMAYCFMRIQSSFFPKKALAAVILGFILVDGISAGFQVSQATAAENVAKWLKSRNLTEQTIPEEIMGHSFHFFLPYRFDTPKRYVVSYIPSDHVLHQEPIKILGRVVKTYYVNELRTAK